MSARSQAETRMWQLARQYTGQVGYQRGQKIAGLNANPPVIDCSGWVAFLHLEVLALRYVDNIWSERIIREIEARGSPILSGTALDASTLPRGATIGLNEGNFDWQKNHPRPRGINHIVQLIRRPADDAPFVSESYGGNPAGIRLSPLAEWFESWQPIIHSGNAWAVDPFTPG